MAEAWRNAVEELYPDPGEFTTTNTPAIVTVAVDEADDEETVFRKLVKSVEEA